jgi:hypothetical protein
VLIEESADALAAARVVAVAEAAERTLDAQ